MFKTPRDTLRALLVTFVTLGAILLAKDTDWATWFYGVGAGLQILTGLALAVLLLGFICGRSLEDWNQ